MSREAELERLFHAALEHTGEAREEFLRRSCPDDPGMLAELRALLDEDERGTAPFLGRGATDLRERPRSIGPYRLLRVLGEGGMGTVYLAHQEEPFARDVALKTLRIGGGSQELAARLEHERDTLAFLDHPAIARLFDAGLSDSGLPYYVMEHVPGRPLTEFCDRVQLGLEGRLRLFQEICAGVQHAHQKGIVHRDLKPGNVLAFESEGRMRVKIIDFGIARAVAGLLALRRRERTGSHALGTLAYMSPEQLDARVEVDTRVDIHALGVILYELLTGALPHDLERLERLGPVEGLRAFTEEEPPLASARVAALGAAAEPIAAARGLSAQALVRRLRGDLERIAARALARERSLRYPSATELSADVERHLRDLPVEAGPRDTGLHLRKFARRHRSVVLVTLVLGLALLAALVATGLGWSRARSEASEARYQAEKARGFTEFVEYALGGAALGALDGSELSAASLLVRTAPDVPALFHERPAAEAAAHDTLGRIFLLLGEDQLAFEQLVLALQLRDLVLPAEHIDRFATLSALVHTSRRLGRTDAARRYAGDALALATRLLARDRPELQKDVATLKRVAEGASNDEAEELAVVDRLLDVLEDPHSRDASALLVRLLLEAGLTSKVGPEYAVRLEERARALLGEGDIRYLTWLWKFTCALAEPGRGVVELATRFATALGERAEAALGRNHWLSIDAHRLLGLCAALRWQGSGADEDRARAESELFLAVDAATASATSSDRLQGAARSFAQLCARLAPAERTRWLGRSWQAWSSGDPAGHGWWPCAQPALPDEVRREALALLEREPESATNLRLRAWALQRLARSAEALAALDRARAGVPEDVAARACRVLCLAALGRTGEARAVHGELLGLLEQPVSVEARGLAREAAAVAGP